MDPRRLDIAYVPFGAQLEAHQAKEDIVLLAGGWGSGKTWWLIAEAIRNTVLNPGRPGVIVSPTFALQRRTIFRAIVDMFPEAKRWPSGKDDPTDALGPMVSGWSAADRVLRFWNGAEWYFGSAEDPGSLEGASYSWGCLDEPRLVRHEAWRIFNARIRDNKSVKLRRSIAGVPSMGWMWDEFGRGLPGRRIVRASTGDNPHLPKGYVGHLNLSDRLARAYLHGEFVVLEGVVFWTYEPRLGSSLVDMAPTPGLASWGALDFGGRRPYFALVQDTEIDGAPAEVVVEEVVGVDTLEAAHAKRCAEMLREHGVTMIDCYCDPAGSARNPQTGLSSIHVYEDALKRAGVMSGQMHYTLNQGERHIPNGVEALRTRLQDMNGARKLYIAEHLSLPKRTTRYPEGVVGIHGSLMGYRYEKNKPGRDYPAKDGVHDHACDALRYYAVGRHGVENAPDIAAMNEGVTRLGDGMYGGGQSSTMEDF